MPGHRVHTVLRKREDFTNNSLSAPWLAALGAFVAGSVYIFQRAQRHAETSKVATLRTKLSEVQDELAEMKCGRLREQVEAASGQLAALQQSPPIAPTTSRLLPAASSPHTTTRTECPLRGSYRRAACRLYILMGPCLF